MWLSIEGIVNTLERGEEKKTKNNNGETFESANLVIEQNWIGKRNQKPRAVQTLSFQMIFFSFFHFTHKKKEEKKENQMLVFVFGSIRWAVK